MTCLQHSARVLNYYYSYYCDDNILLGHNNCELRVGVGGGGGGGDEGRREWQQIIILCLAVTAVV